MPDQLKGAGVFTYQAEAAVNFLLATQGIITQGNVWWVRPRTGSDAADGKSPGSAFRTLTAALAAAVANQNDVVLLCAEGNTASDTTDYQTTTLNWNKNLVHLIGVNGGSQYSPRSRVAFISTYATASNLFTLSANGCLISGIEFFAGVASALPTGCVSVTGARNHFVKCQIAGMGNSLMDTATAYSLQLSGAEECLFEDCVIGQNTVTLGGAANAVLYFASGVTRATFRRCVFNLYTTGDTSKCVFLRAPAGSMDRTQVFDDCLFDNATDSGATSLAHAFVVAAGGSPAGGIVLTGAKTGLHGCTGWNTTASGNVFATGGIQATNTTWGLATAVTS